MIVIDLVSEEPPMGLVSRFLNFLFMNGRHRLPNHPRLASKFLLTIFQQSYYICYQTLISRKVYSNRKMQPEIQDQQTVSRCHTFTEKNFTN